MDEEVLTDLATYYAEMIDTFPDELLETGMEMSIADVYVTKGLFKCTLILSAKDFSLLA